MKKVRPEVLIRPHLYGVISAPMENSKGAESNRKGPWSGQEIGANGHKYKECNRYANPQVPVIIAIFL